MEILVFGASSLFFNAYALRIIEGLKGAGCQYSLSKLTLRVGAYTYRYASSPEHIRGISQERIGKIVILPRFVENPAYEELDVALRVIYARNPKITIETPHYV